MTGLSSDKIIESMVVSENTVSADARFSEDEDGALLDIIPDKDALPADSRVEAESIKIEIGRFWKYFRNVPGIFSKPSME